MNTSFRHVAPLLLMLCVACGGQKTTETPTAEVDTLSTTEGHTDTAISADTATLYGTYVQAGMSTFGLAMADDELSLSKTDDAGRMAVIAGSTVVGDSFAITADMGSEVLLTAINLTQLRKHLPEAVVSNGVLYAPNAEQKLQEADITWLDKDSLCVLFGSGERRTFK